MDTQRNYSCVDITGENVSQNVLGMDIYIGKCLRRMSLDVKSATCTIHIRRGLFLRLVIFESAQNRR